MNTNQLWWATYREARQIMPEAWAEIAAETTIREIENGCLEDKAQSTGVLHAMNAMQGGAAPFPVVFTGPVAA